MAKLAERTVQRQILRYLENSNLLSQHHHAYRNNHNTATALIHLMDSIATASDVNTITATMNIDLTAAFDCVPHGILKKKLEFYGLDDRTKRWISSYLDARTSFVSVGSAQSWMYATPQGVPQGSVLGPLLYLLFVNEMTSIVEDPHCANPVHKMTDRLFARDCNRCGIFPMYADDGQLQISSNSRGYNQDKLELNFWEVCGFLNANGLQVNQWKTKLTEFMTHQKRAKLKGIPPDITVREETADLRGRTRTQDKLISDSVNCKMLGLMMKNDMSWESHLNKGKGALLPALRRQIGMIARIGTNMSEKARLNLANCLIISRLSYMISVWGNTNKTQVRKAQVVQNLAGRLVTNLPKTSRQTEILDRCNWMDIQRLTEYHSLCQMWKFVKWRIPIRLL